MAIRVQAEDFDVAAELAALTAGRSDIGAVVNFIGLVRADAGHGRPDDSGSPPEQTPVTAMTLEHYPGMTERQLTAIEAEAHRRWPLQASLIIHRYGRLYPGEQIVLVITASAHREAAFAACAFLMDWLKTQAPFWKLEETAAGTRWVAARDSDTDAAARWQDSARE